jgi:hypothetical protein
VSVTKFKTSFQKIEAVEVEKETEKSVWIYGYRFGGGKVPLKRADKQTTWERYHDTWAEAHAFLISEAEAKVDAARRQLDEDNLILMGIKSMKPPAEFVSSKERER